MPNSFTTDVDELAQELIDAFNLTFAETEQRLSDPLIRWLDYRLRYIDPCPRQTVKSTGFDSRVPPAAQPALQQFVALSEAGGDLNPYQTKTIKRNDSSGTKAQLRTDGLWTDWHIHHVHLTEAPLAAGQEFSDRSEWLLFFMAGPDTLALIDVRLHNQVDVFQDVSLVEQAIRSWPLQFERFAANGVTGLARQPAIDAESIKKLRTSGVTQMLMVDGKVYHPPGFGVTSAATSTTVSLRRNDAKRLARDIGTFFDDPRNEPMQHAANEGVTNPTFSLAVTDKGRLAIDCKETAVRWRFPTPPDRDDARSQLENLLLPVWAGSKLVAHLMSSHGTGGTT
ncbi:MAG TPA: hypothetical protein VJ577_16895 [Burkholderiaceae bacterium]|nr:hypothetical protein [Burkholderiaceae bacterium]